MKTIIKSIINHIHSFAESYIVFPLVILSIVGSIALVNSFQRAVFDLGSIVDLSVVSLKAILIIMFTTITVRKLTTPKQEDGTHREFRIKVLNLCTCTIFFAFFFYLFCH